MKTENIITNDQGRSFLVRVVMKGDRYGLDDCLTHDKADPLIELYDQTYAGKKGFGPRGQFVSRYYATTLADHPTGQGLCLDGGIPVWSIDGKAAAPVIEMARKLSAKWTMKGTQS